MYACMNLCMHVGTYAYTYVCTHAQCTYTSMYICKHACTYECMYVYLHVFKSSFLLRPPGKDCCQQQIPPFFTAEEWNVPSHISQFCFNMLHGSAKQLVTLACAGEITRLLDILQKISVKGLKKCDVARKCSQERPFYRVDFSLAIFFWLCLCFFFKCM